jgi:hypothetical protein
MTESRHFRKQKRRTQFNVIVSPKTAIAGTGVRRSPGCGLGLFTNAVGPIVEPDS